MGVALTRGGVDSGERGRSERVQCCRVTGRELLNDRLLVVEKPHVSECYRPCRAEDIQEMARDTAKTSSSIAVTRVCCRPRRLSARQGEGC